MNKLHQRKINNITTQDLTNAIYYGVRNCEKIKLQNLKNEGHEIFKNVKIEDTAWPNWFHLPEKLKHVSNFTSSLASSSDCERLTCYPFESITKLCTDKSETKMFKINEKNYTACQKNCFVFNKKELLFPELYWDESSKSCNFANTDFKTWCLFPQFRSKEQVKGLTNVSPFDWYDKEQRCCITKKYCDYFKLEYDDVQKKCKQSKELKILESIFGKYLTRYTKDAFDKIQNDSVNNRILNLSNLDQSDASIPNDTDDHNPDDPDDPDQLLVEGLIDLGLDYGDDLNTFMLIIAKRISKSLLKRVSVKSFVKLGKILTLKTVTKIMIRYFTIHAIKIVAITLTKIALTTFSALFAVTEIISLISTIVDVIDPEGYDNMMTLKSMSMLEKIFWNEKRLSYGLYGPPPYKVSPELLMGFYLNSLYTDLDEDAISEQIRKYTKNQETYMAEYLLNLTVNAAGQSIELIEKWDWIKTDKLFLEENFLTREKIEFNNLTDNISEFYLRPNYVVTAGFIGLCILLLVKTTLKIILCFVLIWTALYFYVMIREKNLDLTIQNLSY